MDKQVLEVFKTHKAADTIYRVGDALFTSQNHARNHASVMRLEVEKIERKDLEKPKKKKEAKPKTAKAETKK